MKAVPESGEATTVAGLMLAVYGNAGFGRGRRDEVPGAG